MRLTWFSLVSVSMAGLHGQTPSAQGIALQRLISPPETCETARLGRVTGIAVTDDGSVYVAEQNPARVTKYESSGRFAGVIAREGAGPGETRTPEIILQGDTLVLFDPALRRLTRFDSRGRVLEERPLGGNATGLPLWVTDDGSILVQFASTAAGFNGAALRLSAHGKLDTIFWTHPSSEDLTKDWVGPNWVIRGATPFSPPGVSTFGPGGELVIGGSKRSQWFVVRGRDTVATVVLPDHAIPINPSVRDSAWNVWFAQVPKAYPQVAEVVRKDLLPTTLPPWISFDIDRRGVWWIGRPGPNGKLFQWEIVGNGRSSGHIQAPATGTKIRSFSKNYLAILQEDENGIPSIGVYKITYRRR